MKTNKIFLTFILFLFCITPMFANDNIVETESTEEHPLMGLWQQCVVVQNPNNPEERTIIKSPNFKYLAKDGSFVNLVLSERRQISNITVYGTYEILSDDTYTEIIERSHTNPNDDNRKVKLNYKIVEDKKSMVITYFSISPITGEAKEISEYWVKVEKGNPFIKN
ncbi:hypothetical protein M2138_002054 [Dysgonomonadaceae bacterium PH5-43]|nr:hypothetical protein [Dysgonomonadaceae bacterium PH5-43]